MICCYCDNDLSCAACGREMPEELGIDALDLATKWKKRALAAEEALARSSERIEEAIAAERERCAKIAETLKTLHCWLPVDNGEDPNHHSTIHGVEIAAAIRSSVSGVAKP